MGKIADGEMGNALGGYISRRAAEHASRERPAEHDAGRVTSIAAGSALPADDIVNRQGEKLGKLLEVMVNVQDGRIAYAVVSGSGSPEGKLLVVPWRALALDPGSRCLTLDLDRDALERAPSFDRNQWSTMADETWVNAVHTYFGTQP